MKRWRGRIDTGAFDQFNMTVYRDVVVEAETRREAALAAQALCEVAEQCYDVIEEKEEVRT